MQNYSKILLKGCCLIVCVLFWNSCGQTPGPASKPKKASHKITQKILKPVKDDGQPATAPTAAAEAAQPLKPAAAPKDTAAKPAASGAQPPVEPIVVAPYNPEGRVDPFVALFKEEPEVVPVVVPETPKEPTEQRFKGPLERIELSQLKLRAVIRSSRGNRALVEEASGRGYIITRGTFIGTRSGTVIDILKDRVVVEEEVKDALGNLKLQETELKFPKPPGEE